MKKLIFIILMLFSFSVYAKDKVIKDSDWRSNPSYDYEEKIDLTRLDDGTYLIGVWFCQDDKYILVVTQEEDEYKAQKTYADYYFNLFPEGWNRFDFVYRLFNYYYGEAFVYIDEDSVTYMWDTADYQGQ